jgi:small multidrug resistance pump
VKNTSVLQLSRFILFLAAAYNICWGVIVSLFPGVILYDACDSVFMLIILKCIGMLVGVYGIAYYFASLDPVRFWPLILTGLIGKVLGPIGSLFYISKGLLDAHFFWVNVFNDIVWIYPFTWVLYQVWKKDLDKKSVVNSQVTLYQQWIGSAFDDMSPELQKFHGAKTPIRVKGIFKVARGTNMISRLLAKLSNLPFETEAEEAELIVTPVHDAEIWSRRIGSKKVISKQWLEGQYLIERFKIVHIYLSAEVVAHDLIIRDVYASLLGMPMPPFLTPSVFARGHQVGEEIEIEVDVHFKPFGRIIHYTGKVKIDTHWKGSPFFS